MEEQSTAAAANEVAINIKNIDEDLAYIFNENRLSTRLSHQLELPKIPKVPKMLRNLEKNKGCFDPHVVSIGPYHHGKDHLEEVEKLKIELARQYCGRFDGLRGNDLYEKVKVVAGEARGFYDIERSKGVNEDQTFTKMMFLDGCFILQFMWLLVEGEYHAMGMKNNVIANVKRDMFLLENQLPYIVLKALMKDEEDEKCWKKRIETYITICRRLHPEVKPRWFISAFRSSPEEKSILHLLDMTREKFVNQSATIQCRKTQISDTNQIRSCSNEWYSYYSARVLNSMGIWFKPNKTGSFSDVKFESQLFIRGVLTLPPILMDASTKSVLLNLLAFESSHNNSADEQGVTSYMCFMDSIIDNAEDVMILRTQNVIVNCLGTDQQVADLFNDIASNLVPNPHTYAEAKRRIQKHCNNKFKKWMAEFLHIHFKSPWTLIALFGSLLLITLTAVQTYFAAKPS